MQRAIQSVLAAAILFGTAATTRAESVMKQCGEQWRHCAPHCFMTLWFPVAVGATGAGAEEAGCCHGNREPV
jgi:hypothetical protein